MAPLGLCALTIFSQAGEKIACQLGRGWPGSREQGGSPGTIDSGPGLPRPPPSPSLTSLLPAVPVRIPLLFLARPSTEVPPTQWALASLLSALGRLELLQGTGPREGDGWLPGLSPLKAHVAQGLSVSRVIPFCSEVGLGQVATEPLVFLRILSQPQVMRIAGHLGQQKKPTQLSCLLQTLASRVCDLETPISTSTLGDDSILFPPGLYKKHGLGTWPHWAGTPESSSLGLANSPL